MFYFSYFNIVFALLLVRHCVSYTTEDFFYSSLKEEESSEVKTNSISNETLTWIVINSHSIPSQHIASAESKEDTQIDFHTKEIGKNIISVDPKEDSKNKTQVEMKEFGRKISDYSKDNSQDKREGDSKEFINKLSHDDNYEDSKEKIGIDFKAKPKIDFETEEIAKKMSVEDPKEKTEMESKELMTKISHDNEDSMRKISIDSKHDVKKIDVDLKEDYKPNTDPKDSAKKIISDDSKEDLDSSRKKLKWFKTDRQKQEKAQNKTSSSSENQKAINKTSLNSNETSLSRVIINSHSIPSLHIPKQRPYNDKIDDIYSWVIINSHTFRKPPQQEDKTKKEQQQNDVKTVPKESFKSKAKVTDKEDHPVHRESTRKTPPRRQGVMGGLRGLVMPVLKSIQVSTSFRTHSFQKPTLLFHL